MRAANRAAAWALAASILSGAAVLALPAAAGDLPPRDTVGGPCQEVGEPFVVELKDTDPDPNVQYYQFVPSDFTIQSGMVVRWVNHDTRDHTTTEKREAIPEWHHWFRTHLEAFEVQFCEVNSFYYRCLNHGDDLPNDTDMEGRLTVEA